MMMLEVPQRASVVLLTCLCFTLVSTAVSGQQSPQLPIVSLGPTTFSLPLDARAEVVCDTHGEMSFETAQTATYSAVQVHTPTSGQCAGYWIRFRAQSEPSSTERWVLELNHPWRHAELFLVRDGVVHVEKTGIDVPPQDRALPSGNTAVPLPLADGSPQVFYLHLVGDTTRFGESRSLDATIYQLKDWLLRQRSLLFGQGIYAGIIVSLALYNLILFLAIGERAYLYYVLYVVSYGTIWIARAGFFFQYLWPQHVLWNQNYLAYVAAAAIVFSVLFVREFLATRTRLPRLDRVMRGIIVLTLFSCVPGLWGDVGLLSLPLAILALGVSFLYAGTGLVALVRGYRPARFFLIAWAALLVGNVIYILMFLRIIPLTFFTYNAAQVGSAIECILLAFALADRVNLVKRAREERQLQYTHELQEQVRQRTGELSDAVERLKTASVTDPLTGLSNRRHVEAAIQPWIADLQRSRIRKTPGEPMRSLAVCLADLDHFKQVNDDLGHAIGDRVLRAAAEILQQNVRATAILARWGGEEFLVLDHVIGPYEDLLMAERLRLSIIQDSSPVTAEIGRSLSLSLGVVRYPFCEAYPELLDWDHCLALADHALYGAKKAGRNRWQCYRSNENALADAIRQQGEEEVRRLLRLHSGEALTLGLIEVIEQIPSGVEVV